MAPSDLQTGKAGGDPHVRVLVVDDDRDGREMLSHLLTSEGFVIDLATNGQEALEHAHAHRPALILLDMMMPVMDGWTFCERRRVDPELASVPVVILSAAPATRLRNLEAAAVLQKPFDYDELLTTIKAHC